MSNLIWFSECCVVYLQAIKLNPKPFIFKPNRQKKKKKQKNTLCESQEYDREALLVGALNRAPILITAGVELSPPPRPEKALFVPGGAEEAQATVWCPSFGLFGRARHCWKRKKNPSLRHGNKICHINHSFPAINYSTGYPFCLLFLEVWKSLVLGWKNGIQMRRWSEVRGVGFGSRGTLAFGAGCPPGWWKLGSPAAINNSSSVLWPLKPGFKSMLFFFFFFF